jgi:hypothetical protein
MTPIVGANVIINDNDSAERRVESSHALHDRIRHHFADCQYQRRRQDGEQIVECRTGRLRPSNATTSSRQGLSKSTPMTQENQKPVATQPIARA